jgi:hypothetical protein
MSSGTASATCGRMNRTLAFSLAALFVTFVAGCADDLERRPDAFPIPVEYLSSADAPTTGPSIDERNATTRTPLGAAAPEVEHTVPVQGGAAASGSPTPWLSGAWTYRAGSAAVSHCGFTTTSRDLAGMNAVVTAATATELKMTSDLDSCTWTFLAESSRASGIAGQGCILTPYERTPSKTVMQAGSTLTPHEDGTLTAELHFWSSAGCKVEVRGTLSQ